MLSQYTQQYYILDPKRQDEDSEKDYSMIIWIQMNEQVADGKMADELSNMFSDFGDFNLYKDSQSSFYIEFYYIEPKFIPSQTAEEVLNVLTSENMSKKLGIQTAVLYKDATKFKAHNRLEYE